LCITSLCPNHSIPVGKKNCDQTCKVNFLFEIENTQISQFLQNPKEAAV